MNSKPCLYTISGSEPVEGIEVKEGCVELCADVLKERTAVALELSSQIVGGRLMSASYDGTFRNGILVRRTESRAILRVTSRELAFEGDPLAGDMTLWPGAEGQIKEAVIVRQVGDRRNKLQDQLVLVRKNNPVWVVDQMNRSYIFNYQNDGQIEWVPAGPYDVAKGIVKILHYKSQKEGQLLLKKTVLWAHHNLCRLLEHHDVPSEVYKARKILEEQIKQNK